MNETSLPSLPPFQLEFRTAVNLDGPNLTLIKTTGPISPRLSDSCWFRTTPQGPSDLVGPFNVVGVQHEFDVEGYVETVVFLQGAWNLLEGLKIVGVFVYEEGAESG